MITELINNQVNFPNGDGILTSQNVNSLFSNKSLSTFDFRSGLVDNSILEGVNNLNHNSSIIDNLSNSVLNIQVTTIGQKQLTIELSGLTFSFNDENLNVGDSLFLDNVKQNEITDISGRYKVISVTQSVSTRTVILEEQDTNVVAGLTSSGNFIWSSVTQPNFVSVNNLKIKSSTVKSGLFRRTLFRLSNLASDSNNLKLINSLFNNTDNKFTNLTLYKSHIINSELDKSYSIESIFNNSIVRDSVVSSSYWLSGTLLNGIFSNSSEKTLSNPDYSFSSFYKSWNSGDFYGREFNKSMWLSGTFYTGKFFDSDWLSGTWVNGVLGERTLKSENTTFGNIYNDTTIGATNSLWINGSVENAVVGGSSSIVWQNGNFNAGVFTSYLNWSSIWENGEFNSGLFEGYSTWENGNFNRGRFESIWGIGQETSTQSSDWAWQNGNFYNGIFGKADFTNNPSWFNGVFWEGVFQGKVWNNGHFINGEFIGSSTYSAVSQTDEFIESFTSSNYYGLWRNGTSTADIFTAIPSLNLNTNLSLFRDPKKRLPSFKDMVWVSGTFSNQSATINNSIWLDGIFENGTMNSSTFNPYIDSGWFSGSASGTQSFNISNNIVWKNGTFNDGNFNLSKWENGTFVRGTMSGTYWKNGTWNYGSANNVLWENGRWRNGNWDGSPFDYTNLNNSGLLDKKSSQMTQWVNNSIDITEDSYNKLHTINVGYATFSNINLVPFDEFTYLTDGETSYGWAFSSGTASVKMPLSISDNLYPEILICRENCEKTNDIFWDDTIGYLVSINAYSEFGTNMYLNLNIGGLTGPNSPAPLPGQAGFDSLGSPQIHLNTNPGTYSFIYYPKPEDQRSFTIRAQNLNASSYNTSIRNITITKIESLYNTTYNNNLVSSNLTTTPQLPFGNTFSTLYIVPADNSRAVSIRFGNGLFKSGTWENGVWNNGWRKDNNRYKFDSVVNFVRISNFSYFLTISGSNSSQFEVGERVSVSNICGIDLNGNKVLLKSSFRVLEKTSNTLKLEVVFSTNLRNVQIDSPNHKITVSKNIWLSGAFLNGYFKGIMNYGLVKGYPMITNINESHLIDVVFDSGRISTTASTSDFSTLIQNMDFIDASYLKPIDRIDLNYNIYYNRNYSNLGVKNRKYLSWLDLNWNTNSRSNTFDDFSYFNVDFGSEYKNINHMSRITTDVLRSTSTLRNISNTDLTKLSLGSDYKKFRSTIPFGGRFDFSSLFVDGIGINSANFIERGWSFTNSISSIFSTQSSTFSSNYGVTQSFDANTLLVETEKLSLSGLSAWNFKNSNVTFRNNRYSMVELVISTFSGDSKVELYPGLSVSEKYPRLYFRNKQSLGYPSLESNPVNHLETSNTIKTEFFYNLEKGEFTIFGGSDFSAPNIYGPSYSSIRFNYINYFETDMIPFFRYYTDSTGPDRIDRYVKVPNRAIAPEIDYSNTDFDFIGNITLTGDSVSSDIVNYPTSPPPLKSLYEEVSSTPGDVPELDS